jgi:hypothetical protein
MATVKQSFTQSHVVIISGEVLKDNAYKKKYTQRRQVSAIPGQERN